MGDILIVQVQDLRESVAVFCIPAGVVAGVDHTLTALGLGGLILSSDHIGLVVEEQQHIAPFLEQGSDLLGQLHLPAVIGTHLVGLLKFPHFCVGGNHHMDASSDDPIQRPEEGGKLFCQVGMTLAVAKVLQTGFLILGTHMADCQLLCPVSGVDHQTAADVRGHRYFVQDIHQLHPSAGFCNSADIHMGGATLSVDEQRVGEHCCEGTLADTFTAVQHNLLRSGNSAIRNLQHSGLLISDCRSSPAPVRRRELRCRPPAASSLRSC